MDISSIKMLLYLTILGECGSNSLDLYPVTLDNFGNKIFNINIEVIRQIEDNQFHNVTISGTHRLRITVF